jgi:hypothetical protein
VINSAHAEVQGNLRIKREASKGRQALPTEVLRHLGYVSVGNAHPQKNCCKTCKQADRFKTLYKPGRSLAFAPNKTAMAEVITRLVK